MLKAPTLTLPSSSQGESLSQTLRKMNALQTEAQFQPVTELSITPVIAMVVVTLGFYFLSLVSEPLLTNPDEFHEASRGLKVSKAMGPVDIPNRSLKHLPKQTVSLFALSSMQFFVPIIFPKRGSKISILKPG